MYGIDGAWAMMSWLTLAHALARSAGSTTSLAASISLLIAGTFIAGQFEFCDGMMFSPLNVGSSIVCGSAKSCAQPTDGQTLTSEAGTLQNFVNIVSRVTSRSVVLKPISLSCCSVIWEIDFSGSALSATSSSLSLPSYLPDDMPAVLKYSADSARSPSGWASQSSSLLQPLRPPDSLKPAMPGGIMCWAIGPSASPPRCCLTATRLKPAITALRTLMSLNGGRELSIEIMRQPLPETADSSGLLLWSSRLSWLAGGSRSPDAMLWPERIRRVATDVSSLPPWMSISSRYAGRKSSTGE